MNDITQTIGEHKQDTVVLWANATILAALVGWRQWFESRRELYLLVETIEKQKGAHLCMKQMKLGFTMYCVCPKTIKGYQKNNEKNSNVKCLCENTGN